MHPRGTSGNRERRLDPVEGERIRAAERLLLQTNHQYALRKRVRTRINMVLRGRGLRKMKKTRSLLGCSWHHLRLHIEQQFTEGMDWENKGIWQVDHIRPLSSFDLTTEHDQRQAFHFSNLQPLWAIDNQRKSDLLEDGTRGRHRVFDTDSSPPLEAAGPA